jgi:shikimate dehydrogenase
MKILGTTQVVGVMGYPVRHSFSPPMHNAAFAALGLDFCYVAFEVAPENLSAALAGMRGLGLVGLNATIPHKQALLSLLDGISEEARLIGAVNTIHHREGQLWGDNTDGRGFVASLQAAGEEPAGRKVVLLGAGGSARAVSVALARAGVAEIVIANRTLERGVALAAFLHQNVQEGLARSVALPSPALSAACVEADLIVNTTAAGMYPQVELLPVTDLPALSSRTLVYDIIYNPRQTRLLRLAAERGARTRNGVDMLVYQGALAFQQWTGQTPPVEVMREALIRELEGRA